MLFVFRSDRKCPICGANYHVIHSFTNTIGLPEGEKITFQLLCQIYGDPLTVIIDENEEETKTRIMTVNYETISFVFYSEKRELPLDQNSELWKLHSITTRDPNHIFEHDIHVGSKKRDIIRVFKRSNAVKGEVFGTAYWDNAGTSIIYFSFDENDNVLSIKYYSFLLSKRGTGDG